MGNLCRCHGLLHGHCPPIFWESHLFRGEIQPRSGGRGEYGTAVYSKKTGKRIGFYVRPTVEELKTFLAKMLPGFYIASKK